ncbi:hypothetical protein C2845_PM04G15470 [Panicum miliaceum]|uniref:Uncharacterized protein n=1 Tax=Panicum miliaceum TaxID=4540 RepID=A0A3L6QN64_PANMI|nr:hypothetical protein C2845_PM04G15470 [Panicum miliaceum]
MVDSDLRVFSRLKGGGGGEWVLENLVRLPRRKRRASWWKRGTGNGGSSSTSRRWRWSTSR